MFIETNYSFSKENIVMPQNNRDPLGLTLPPTDVSDICTIIVPGHTPEDADIADKDWNSRGTAWKYCFIAYRIQTFGNTDEELRAMLKHNGGDIWVKRHRLRNKTHKGNYCYRYVKFSQDYVDRWVKIARVELTLIHNGDEEYAVSLLPI